MKIIKQEKKENKLLPDWSLRNDLINIQKDIFRKLDKRVREYVSHPAHFEAKEYQRYENEYQESVRHAYEPSCVRELKREILRSDIIIVGDFHTLVQSQKTFLKLVNFFRTRNVIIGLEFVAGKYQDTVDKYVKGRITDETLLKRIDYKNTWDYDIWANFKPIFEHARRFKIPVTAIDCPHEECGNLAGRDSYAAWRIVESMRHFPGRHMAVLIGDSHTCPDHLPKRLKESLEYVGLRKEILVVHQNIEGIYWDLLGRGLEHETEVVRLEPDRFCIINTPPIIVQQSYLNWLDYETETLDFTGIEKNFISLVKVLARFLKIEVKEPLENLSVFGPGDIRFVHRLKSRLSEEKYNELLEHIKYGESAYIPECGVAYLGNLSLNHAGEEASHFVKVVSSGYGEPEEPEDLFYSRILHEAIGFFGSKVINPKRKTPHETYYRELIKESAKNEEIPEKDVAVARLVLIHKQWEKRNKWHKNFTMFFIDDSEVFFRLVHALGYIMGEKLYYGMLSGCIKVREIQNLYSTNFEEAGVAQQLYIDLIKKVGRVKIPKRL